jgi:putative ABC transport system permease protein
MPSQSISYGTYTVEGAEPVAKSAEPLTTQRRVGETYFQTMGMPMIRGRSFARQEVDDPKSDPIVVNQMFAKTIWPGQDPIGKAIRMRERRRRVIGVVGDARQLGPDAKISPEVYLPDVELGNYAKALAIRSALGPTALTAPLSREVWAIDKDLPIQEVATMDEALGEWVSERRFVMSLLGAFAALALVLAGVGIYGVLAYSVSQRTREIGIRMAVGASTRDVVKLVLREGMMLTAVGVVAGLAGAAVLTRLMQGLLFGVATTDPGTFFLGVIVLVGASMLAAYFPARRASKLAPLDALRVE